MEYFVIIVQNFSNMDMHLRQIPPHLIIDNGRSGYTPQPYVCLYCPNITDTHGDHLDHLANMHNHNPRYSCTFPSCSWTDHDAEAARAHAATHSVTHSFVCPYPLCGKRYKSLMNLKCHMLESLDHMSEEDYQNPKYRCKKCNRRFKTSSTRSQHQSRKHKA